MKNSEIKCFADEVSEPYIEDLKDGNFDGLEHILESLKKFVFPDEDDPLFSGILKGNDGEARLNVYSVIADVVSDLPGDEFDVDHRLRTLTYLYLQEMNKSKFLVQKLKSFIEMNEGYHKSVNHAFQVWETQEAIISREDEYAETLSKLDAAKREKVAKNAASKRWEDSPELYARCKAYEIWMKHPKKGRYKAKLAREILLIDGVAEVLVNDKYLTDLFRDWEQGKKVPEC